MKIYTRSPDLDSFVKHIKGLLELGYEVKKPLYIDWRGNYAVKFSNHPNPNSSYLKFKRARAKLHREYESLSASLKEASS